MKAAIVTAIPLAAMTLPALAQECIYAHCGRQGITTCDPRCCDLPPSCVRGGPIRVVPPRFRPHPRPLPAPGPRGGIGIK
jgi:hypothetical protein